MNNQKPQEVTYKKIDNYFFDPTTKPLGKGAFGTVYKATDERTGQPVAVKVIPAKKLLESQQQYDLFMREIQVLQQIKGTHIVCLLDVKQTSNNLYIFTDFCDGGDLEKKLKLKKSYPEEEACSILKQIADAFVTIHDMHIKNSKGIEVTMMHRDIKAANIIFHEGRVKVADFGFAKFIEEAQQNTRQANTLLGTPLYMPPQILNDERYSTKCDIWSTGILFYELLFGQLPWTGNSITHLYKNILGKPLTFPKDVRKETQDLLRGMLQVKEQDRMTWREVYEHPALRSTDITVFRPMADQLKALALNNTGNRRPSTKNEPSNNSGNDQKHSPTQVNHQGQSPVINQLNQPSPHNGNLSPYGQNNSPYGQSPYNQQQQHQNYNPSQKPAPSPRMGGNDNNHYHNNYNYQQQNNNNGYNYASNQQNNNYQQNNSYDKKPSHEYQPENYQAQNFNQYNNRQPHPSYR